MGKCFSSPEGDWAEDDAEMLREEDRIEGKINYKVDDPRFVEMQKWPIVLLDTTGSMNMQCELNDPKPRNQLVYETIWQMAQMLIPYDTMDNDDDNPEFSGLNPQQILMQKGIPLITFNAIDGGVDRGLLHPTSFAKEWSRIKWRGGTHIMDGWRKMLRTYEAKFSDLPQGQWPLLLGLVITDGELQDGPEFEEHLKHVKGRMFVEIAVVGYGEDHDKAYRHYQKISRKHDHVRVTAFTDGLDPAVIVKRLLSLIDPKAVQQINSTQAAAPSLNVLRSNSSLDFNNQNVLYSNMNSDKKNQAIAPPYNPNYS